MPNEKKVRIVDDLKKQFDRAAAVVFVDYTGLGVNRLNKLRKALDKTDAKFTVAKNTLIQRALASNPKFPASKLEGPTAVIFGSGDPLSPVKKLYEFIKEFELPRVKRGIFEGSFIDAAQVEELSKIPTREALLGKLAAVLQAPLVRLLLAGRGNIKSLAGVLSAVKGKKG